MSIPPKEDDEFDDRSDRPVRVAGEWRPAGELRERRAFRGSRRRRERGIPWVLLVAVPIGGLALALFGPWQRTDPQHVMDREQELAKLQSEPQSAEERATQLETEPKSTQERVNKPIEPPVEKPIEPTIEKPVEPPVVKTEAPEPPPEPVRAPKAQARRELTPEEVLGLDKPAAKAPTAASAPTEPPTPSPEPPLAEPEPDQVALAESQRSTSLFEPPDPSAPGIRSGSAACQVLTPAETGWTISAKPNLYWHAASGMLLPGVFTLTREGLAEPILRGRLEAPEAPGIQRIELLQTAVSLEEGVSYRWKITFADPAHPEASRDAASGGIRRVAPPEKLRATGESATVSERLDALERAGIWYDAFDLVTRSIENNSGAQYLVARRSSMLARVGIYLPSS